MSTKSIKLSFLQISPKVWADENHLYAKTSKFYRFLNLFSYSKTVVADRIKKQIEIKNTTFWFFTSKKYISFDDIKYIDIKKREAGNVFGFTPLNNHETWYVQVIMKNSPIPENLFRFIGDGGYDSSWVGVYLVDCEGSQYEKALHYAEQVSKYTGSQLGKDIDILNNFKILVHYKCVKCGHESTSKTECIYCGGRELESIS